MTAPLLELRNIETYYGPIMAIRGVSLNVDEGEIVAVLGANGAGKTTLLKTATGALDSNKGQVLLDGEQIQCRDPDWVARKGIAHVPEGREVFPFLTVAENLAMGAFNRSDKDAIAKDVETVYGYFPALKQLDDRMAAYLSGGQQQMLAIGRGFMARPRLLMLDEPSLGLSPVLVKEIFEIISRLNDEQGLTILLVEQNANVALQVSDRGYVMEVGGMVMDGPSEHLIESEDIKEFYLGKKEEGVRGRRRWKKRKTWR
ncbi:MAG: ATP-binding cassette domain-containing protein [Woeseiaceae bacterium]|nr:ATP-binding cassette domain-containing protein [Woeseiaceae bacterium]NIP19796.1 ATP-binding cassette domain-containing protein [Woeseiaceae bacterium]NIS89913.1 ATP-binding cassette domain-containing protein [Woeseiaceae bacterium]